MRLDKRIDEPHQYSLPARLPSHGNSAPGGFSVRVESEERLLRRLIHTAWRRRFLILVPILVLAPLSVFVARLLPLTYDTRSLLLLQEPMRDTDPYRGDSNQDRVAGFAALLNSDQVLRGAASDLGYPPTSDDHRVFLGRLKKRLSINILGRQFLEIRLNGDTRNGLGHELEVITSRFLRVLLGDQFEATAGQFLIMMNEKELAAANNKVFNLESTLRSILPLGPQEGRKSLNTINQQIGENKVNLELTQNYIAQLDKPTAVMTPDQTPNPPISSSANRAMAVLGQRRDNLVRSIARLEEAARQLGRSLTDFAKLTNDAEAQKRIVTELQARHELLVQRYGSMEGGSAKVLIEAPALIKLIDMPKDPEYPTTSRSLYMMLGLVASIVLGTGLGLLGEFFDERVSDPEKFESLSSLPIVAHVPKATFPKQPRKTAWIIAAFAVVAVILFCLAIFITNRAKIIDLEGTWSSTLNSINEWSRKLHEQIK